MDIPRREKHLAVPLNVHHEKKRQSTFYVLDAIKPFDNAPKSRRLMFLKIHSRNLAQPPNIFFAILSNLKSD